MGLARYYAFKERSAKLPHVTVTREEFIRRLVERGESQEKAEQMATVAEGLGSHVEIGDEMVGIKDEN